MTRRRLPVGNNGSICGNDAARAIRSGRQSFAPTLRPRLMSSQVRALAPDSQSAGEVSR